MRKGIRVTSLFAGIMTTPFTREACTSRITVGTPSGPTIHITPPQLKWKSYSNCFFLILWHIIIVLYFSWWTIVSQVIFCTILILYFRTAFRIQKHESTKLINLELQCLILTTILSTNILHWWFVNFLLYNRIPR